MSCSISKAMKDKNARNSAFTAPPFPSYIDNQSFDYNLGHKLIPTNKKS